MAEQAVTYFTIGKNSQGLFKDKGSKFLAFAYPVNNEVQVKDILTEVKKEYFDARHHCYAYRLGPDHKTFRTNDDGEPSGTAGKPILGQIMSHQLTNILIIVVRYFGGTLLGTSGLIQAYKEAALDAIVKNEIVKKYVYQPLFLTFQYPQLNQVMKIVKDFNLEISHQKFEISCQMEVFVKLQDYDQVVSRISTIDGAQIILEGDG